jgi:hypothetical protein
MCIDVILQHCLERAPAGLALRLARAQTAHRLAAARCAAPAAPTMHTETRMALPLHFTNDLEPNCDGLRQ